MSRDLGHSGSEWQGEFRLNRFPVFTVLCCVVQLGLYVVLSHRSWALDLDTLIAHGAKVDALILELGQTWRLFSANLLHRDVLHLGFNVFFLFNLGGVMENVLEREDYILVVVASALGTTILSLFFLEAPSVGSSGIVLGLFGSASVFGYQYNHRIPARYQRYFGGAALPYALLILYMGLTSSDTDNWGHVGGLIAGGVVTLGLCPRWLRASRPGRIAPVGLGIMLVATVGTGMGLRAWGPARVTHVHKPSGLVFERPRRWKPGENHLGDRAWGNILGVGIGFRAERRDGAPPSLEAFRAEFVAELRDRERRGDILGVRLVREVGRSVSGAPGVELTVRLESRAGVQVTRNLLIVRGRLSYRIVLNAPLSWTDAYAPTLESLVSSVRLVEPRALRRARDVVATFPGMMSAHVELGRRLAEAGEVQAAERAFERALHQSPQRLDALRGLARLRLDYGGDLEGAERRMADAWARHPEHLPVVLVLADLRHRLGRRKAACEALGVALDRLETPESLRSRWIRWRCGSVTSAPR